MRGVVIWTTPYRSAGLTAKPPSSPCPSPPYRGSSSPTAAEIAPIEGGDSRDSVDELTKAVNGHLEVAKQQSANIAELTKLVASQANTVTMLISRTQS